MANAVRGNKSFTADLYPLGLAGAVRHLRTTQQFFADAAAGTLPAVSIVDPDFGAYSEENPQDIAAGEAFSARWSTRSCTGPAGSRRCCCGSTTSTAATTTTCRRRPRSRPTTSPRGTGSSPAVGARAAALLAPKLLAGLENADDGPATYDRYGFRVPAVIVSPYARPDFVLHDVLDHTSVLKLIEEKWNLPPLTRRDAAAVSPLGALDLDAPPAFLTPPVLPGQRRAPSALGCGRGHGCRLPGRRRTWRAASQEEVGAAFADHDGGGVGVA